MSSAILYVAIVVIWACVLIPRWLHRGSVAAVTEPTDHSSERIVASPQDSFSPDADAEAADDDEPDVPQEPEYEPEPSESRPRRSPPREESRRKMLAARRRLLLMLLALQAAAVALTVLDLTAPWVLIPPTVMLAGYLLLLREAAHADAERAEREAEAEAARSRGRAAAGARVRERRAAPPPSTDAPPPPPAPRPEDYSDLGDGRDFAPGLAGKYTTSDSGVIDLSEYKRAVGD